MGRILPSQENIERKIAKNMEEKRIGIELGASGVIDKKKKLFGTAVATNQIDNVDDSAPALESNLLAAEISAETEIEKRPCKHFSKGKCAAGTSCPYSHTKRINRKNVLNIS